MEKKKSNLDHYQKINKKINSKEKKKYPLHELKRRRLWWEAKGRRLGVGGKGLPVGWKVKGRWKRHQMVRTEASRDGVS